MSENEKSAKNENLETKIIKKVNEIQPELIKAIKELVKIYSVEGKEEKNKPYGKAPKEALEKTLEISEKLGFRTKNIDNKIGYAEFGDFKDKNKDYIGIFGHVDVVPLGEGWQHPPLEGVIENNRMYGRGVLDNKGPILSNLFALYVLKECEVKFNLPVRIVFGTNEETGFKCVKHYMTKERAPLFGWTPDCKWPVVYGERGRLRARVLSSAKNVSKLYNFVNDFILSAPNNGVKLGINFKDEDFGEMILRGYKFGILQNVEEKNENRRHFFEWSMSYPASTTKEQLIALIEEKLDKNLELEEISNWNPILYDKDSKYVQILQKVYNEITGLNVTPVTTTGGTYAKIIPNIIAYGPSYPNQKDIAHLPDEWIDLEDLKMNTQIYAIALYRLSKM